MDNRAYRFGLQDRGLRRRSPWVRSAGVGPRPDFWVGAGGERGARTAGQESV